QGARAGDGSDTLSVIAAALPEALNGLVELADLPERVAPCPLLDGVARVFEEADRTGEVVPWHLQVQQLVPGLPHLLLDERRDVPVHPFLRPLPEPEGAGDIPPVERLTPLPEESLRVAEVHAHRAGLAREPIAVVDDLARLVEAFRLRMERPEGPLQPVPGSVVVARLQPADGLLELRRRRLDARVPFGGAEFLDDGVDLSADEVDEGDVQRSTGVRDERDRAFDVASLARLDRVVDDPLPLLDLEPDPLCGDQEG